MDVRSKSREARRLDESGNLPEALARYREVLAELERDPPKEHFLPLCIRIGELTLRLEGTSAATASYERGAELFAHIGDAQSVAELCLRILRTDPTRKDVHARLARRLLDYGHTESARQLLLDYARRARSDNLLRILSRMDQWSESELQRLLNEFLDRIVPRSADGHHVPDRPASPAAPGGSTPAPTPPPLPEQPVLRPRREPESGAVARPPTETKPPPPIPTEVPVTVARATALPATPPLEAPPPEEAPRRVAPAPAPEPEHRARDGEAPQLAPVRTEPPSQPRPSGVLRPPPRSPAAVKPRRRRVPAALRVAFAAAVLVAAVLGYVLAPPGLVPFGAQDVPVEVDVADATPPPEVVPVPTDSQRPAVELAAPAAPDPDAEAVSDLPTTSPAVEEPPGVGVRDPSRPTVPPVEPRSEQGAEPAEALPTQVAVVTADSSVTAIADTVTAAEPAAASDPSTPEVPQGLELPERLVMVEGLPVLDVSTFEAPAGQGHRVTQLLQSGDTLSLTVVPLEPATASQVGVGRVRVQASGTSAIGTTRFGLYLVTGRALLSASEMEDLLRRLLEIAPQ